MKEIYRIKKGTLKSNAFEIPFDFGLVFMKDGLYSIDFYISDSYALLQHPANTFDSEASREDVILLREVFTMNALTDTNNIITADELNISSLERHLFKMSAVCYGSIVHKKTLDEYPISKINKAKEEYNIFYVELEGLKLEFSEVTSTRIERSGVLLNRVSRYKRDYTGASLVYNDDIVIGNHYPIIFSSNKDSDNIILSFAPANEKTGPPMPYSLFLKIKRDLISLLSFANGADVRVRSEHTGSHYNLEKVNSEITVLYSYPLVKNQHYSTFFSLGNLAARGERILESMLLNCFDKFVAQNKLYDLNTIIFHLNGATQADNLHQRFFTLIILLEKLSKSHVDNLNSTDMKIIDTNDFEDVRQQLIDVLINNREKLGEKLNTFRSKIYELNTIKSKSTEFKFIKLLEHAQIPITNEIQKIINEIRHSSIHAGEIGDDKESVINYFELDELIRRIICKLIGYNKGYFSYKHMYSLE